MKYPRFENVTSKISEFKSCFYFDFVRYLARDQWAKKITQQNSLKCENSEQILFIVGKSRSVGLMHSVLCCIVNKKENFFLITMLIGNKQATEQKRWF